jgi:hypothetical protein
MLLGTIFLGLGGWALIFPATVEGLVLRPEHYIGSPASSILIGCFGAQAVLCSVVIFTSTFTARTFLIFGLVGSLPFFAFNYYFVYVLKIFSSWMLIDFIGNAGILLCGIIGWRLAKAPALNPPG